MNSNESTLKSYLLSPHTLSLVSFINDSKEHWVIKDNEANYVFVNEAAFEFFRFPKKFNPEGKSDREVPTKICEELWPDFIKTDKEAIKNDKVIKTIAIHHYGKNNTNDILVPHLSERMPIYDSRKKVIGILTHGRAIDAPQLLYYINRLKKMAIQFDAPNDLFTPRELEIIFWAQQRLSAKEIAKRLNLSPRTVENRLSLIYEKVGVHSIIQLVEYCKQTGLDSYIPPDFIRKGVQLIE